MVQTPQRVKTRKFALCPLLPVNPPEVHAVCLVLVMPDVHITVDEFCVGNVEFHRFFFVLIYPHRVRDFVIAILKPTEAVRRVQIQSGF